MKKENLTLRYYLGVSAFIVGELLFLILSQTFIKNNFWQNIADDIAGTLFMSGALGLVNDLILKNEMIALIIEKLKVKEEIDKTGILSFYKSSDAIKYKTFFDSSKRNIESFSTI